MRATAGLVLIALGSFSGAGARASQFSKTGPIVSGPVPGRVVEVAGEPRRRRAAVETPGSCFLPMTRWGQCDAVFAAHYLEQFTCISQFLRGSGVGASPRRDSFRAARSFRRGATGDREKRIGVDKSAGGEGRLEGLKKVTTTARGERTPDADVPGILRMPGTANAWETGLARAAAGTEEPACWCAAWRSAWLEAATRRRPTR